MKHTSTLFNAQLNNLHTKFVIFFIAFASQKRSSFLFVQLSRTPSCMLHFCYSFSVLLFYIYCLFIFDLFLPAVLLFLYSSILLSYAPFVYFPHRHAISFALPNFFSSDYYSNPEKHTQGIDK